MGMIYKRGAVWWIKYYRNGRGLRESSHSAKGGDARRLLKLREGDIEHGLLLDPKLNRIRFEEAAEEPEDGVDGTEPIEQSSRPCRKRADREPATRTWASRPRPTGAPVGYLWLIL